MTRVFCRTLAAAFLFASPALAAPSVTLSPAAGHPQQQFGVSGAGFSPNRAVDIYWDTTDEMLVSTNASGAFSSHQIQAPADALPGTHWVTAVERDNGASAQAAFFVRTIWAEHGFSARGKRFNPYENVISPANAARLDVAWTFKTGDIVSSSPAVAYGNVYIGSNDGKLYALDAITGAKKWSAQTGGTIQYSSPAVSGSTVYVGSNDGYVWAFDTASGAMKWKFLTGGYAGGGSPTVANGTVYIGATDGKLYALNASTGVQKWSAATGSAIYSAPAVSDGSVFVGSFDTDVYAFAAASGAYEWSTTTSGNVFASPVAAYGEIFVGSQGDDFYELDPDTGIGSSTHYGSYITSSAAAAYGYLYFADGNGVIHAVSNRHQDIWDDNVGASIVASPAVANGVAVFADSNGNVYALDAQYGSILWSSNAGLYVDASSPAIADGRIYVGSHNGRVYAYAIDGGNAAVYRRDANPPRMELLHPNRKLKPVR